MFRPLLKKRGTARKQPDGRNVLRRSTGVLWLLAGLLLCGCGGGRDADRVVFAVGGAPDEIRVWEQIAHGFSRETGIAVRILRQPTDTAQRRQALLVALGSGQRDPDVFLMDIAWLGLFAASGWLAPLGGVDLDAFFPQVVEKSAVFDGRLLALPVSLDVGILYYRTDLLEGRPPQTWEELAAEARRVQNSLRPRHEEFYGFVWTGAQYEGLVVAFLDFAGRRGGLVVEENRILVHSAANVDALATMVDFIHALGISPPNTYTEMKEEEVRRHFQSGAALFERNWPYAYPLHRSAESPVQVKIGVAPLPAPEPGGRAATLGGWHVGVSAFSDRIESARRFARYLASAPVQKKLVLALGLPPSRRELYADADVLNAFPHYPILAETLRTARPRPMVPHYTLISEILQRRISGALARIETPAEALAGAQEEIDRLTARAGGPISSGKADERGR